MLQEITDKIFSGIRITSEEGLWLLREAELLDLAPLADFWRQKHNPNKDVSYVVDTNLNYTNLCDAYCSFCAFYRTDPNDPSAYT
jgi:cyclic dehypoxanthinyl futalosine synthase